MSLSELSESEFDGSDCRSSVRARTLLPCAVTGIHRSHVAELESAILDMAVLDHEHANLAPDWAEHSESLPRDLTYVLSEMRALRQQVVELQRQIGLSSQQAITPRWVVLNDRGLWLPRVPEDDGLAEGELVKVELHIPSMSSPKILALAEIIRIRAGGARPGLALEFRAISSIHSNAIIQYALRRERQIARSKLYEGIRKL